MDRSTCIAPPSGGLRRRNSVGAAKKAAIVACHCSESPSSVHYSLYESRTTLVIWVTNYAHHQLWSCITNDIYVYRHRGVSLHRISERCVSLVMSHGLLSLYESRTLYYSHQLCTGQSALNIQPAPGKSWFTVGPYEWWEYDYNFIGVTDCIFAYSSAYLS